MSSIMPSATIYQIDSLNQALETLISDALKSQRQAVIYLKYPVQEVLKFTLTASNTGVLNTTPDDLWVRDAIGNPVGVKFMDGVVQICIPLDNISGARVVSAALNTPSNPSSCCQPQSASYCSQCGTKL
jgi:hypothetical protein